MLKFYNWEMSADVGQKEKKNESELKDSVERQ